MHISSDKMGPTDNKYLDWFLPSVTEETHDRFRDMNIAKKAMTVFLTLLATPFFMRERTMNWLIGRVSTTATSDAAKTSRAAGFDTPPKIETEFLDTNVDEMVEEIKKAFPADSSSTIIKDLFSAHPGIDTGLIYKLKDGSLEEDPFFDIVSIFEVSDEVNKILKSQTHEGFNLASRYLNVELVKKYPGVENKREREKVASEINVLRYRALVEVLANELNRDQPIVLHRFQRGFGITPKWDPVIINPSDSKEDPIHIAVATHPTNSKDEDLAETEAEGSGWKGKDIEPTDPLSDFIEKNDWVSYYDQMEGLDSLD